MKKDKAIETIRLNGYPKIDLNIQKDDDRNAKVLDYICRAVMRNPSIQAMTLMSQIKEKLKVFFKDSSNEEIEWVFSHGQESRGFFKKGTDHQDERASLMTWLNEPVSEDTTSMDISCVFH